MRNQRTQVQSPVVSDSECSFGASLPALEFGREAACVGQEKVKGLAWAFRALGRELTSPSGWFLDLILQQRLVIRLISVGAGLENRVAMDKAETSRQPMLFPSGPSFRR